MTEPRHYEEWLCPFTRHLWQRLQTAANLMTASGNLTYQASVGSIYFITSGDSPSVPPACGRDTGEVVGGVHVAWQGGLPWLVLWTKNYAALKQGRRSAFTQAEVAWCRRKWRELFERAMEIKVLPPTQSRCLKIQKPAQSRLLACFVLLSVGL